ncbi:MAG: hypothetical protein RL660_1895, partial [Bacteroidota bacterium]
GKEYGHFYSYPSNDSGAAYLSGHDGAIYYSGANRPDIVLTNNSGVVQAASANENYWDIQITGANTNPAKYIWLATEKFAGSGIDVVAVEYPVGTPLIGTSYGTDKTIYEVNATGLANPNFNIVRVYFSKVGCGSDSLKIRSGWDCTAFATSANNSCASKDLTLKATSALSEIQLLITEQPALGATIDICAPVHYKLRVRSTQNGDLDNPRVQIVPPLGMTVVGNSFTYSYAGDNNPEVFTVAPVAGVHDLLLEDHSVLQATGLNGVSTANNADERTAFVEFDLQVTSCTFKTGGVPRFTVFGNRVCGGVATGNGLVSKARPVKVAPQVGGPTLSNTISVNPTVISCGAPVAVSSSITSSDGNNYEGDSALYLLPKGLRIVPGSVVIVGTYAAMATTDSSIEIHMGNNAGNTIDLNFAIEATSEVPCSADPFFVNSQVYRSRGYNCPATFGSCQIAELTSDDTLSVTAVKPQLEIPSFVFTENSGNITYDMAIANAGNQDASAGQAVINIFCNDSTGALLHSINNLGVSQGSTVAHTGSFAYNTAICAQGSSLFAKVADTTAAGTPACVCATTKGTISASTPLAVVLKAFDAIGASTGYNQINWQMLSEEDVDHYSVECSNSSSNGFKQIAETAKDDANNKSYTALHKLPSGNDYYRLKVTTSNGHFYSNVVQVKNQHVSNIPSYTVFPNPAANVATLQFASKRTGLITVGVYDMLGKQLFSSEYNVQYGVNNIGIDVAKLANGQYIIRYTDVSNNERGLIKFSKN